MRKDYWAVLLSLMLLTVIFNCAVAYSPEKKTLMQSESIDHIKSQITQIEGLPAGTEFSLQLSDSDLTAAANDYLKLEEERIDKLVGQYTSVNAKLSDPTIKFRDGFADISIRAGVSFIKVTAKASLTVKLENGIPFVTITSADIPVVKVTPDQLNGYVQPYVNNAFGIISKSCELRSVTIEDGWMKISAVRR